MMTPRLPRLVWIAALLLVLSIGTPPAVHAQDTALTLNYYEEDGQLPEGTEVLVLVRDGSLSQSLGDVNLGDRDALRDELIQRATADPEATYDTLNANGATSAIRLPPGGYTDRNAIAYVLALIPDDPSWPLYESRVGGAGIANGPGFDFVETGNMQMISVAETDAEVMRKAFDEARSSALYVSTLQKSDGKAFPQDTEIRIWERENVENPTPLGGRDSFYQENTPDKTGTIEGDNLSELLTRTWRSGRHYYVLAKTPDGVFYETQDESRAGAYVAVGESLLQLAKLDDEATQVAVAAFGGDMWSWWTLMITGILVTGILGGLLLLAGGDFLQKKLTSSKKSGKEQSEANRRGDLSDSYDSDSKDIVESDRSSSGSGAKQAEDNLRDEQESKAPESQEVEEKNQMQKQAKNKEPTPPTSGLSIEEKIGNAFKKWCQGQSPMMFKRHQLFGRQLEDAISAASFRCIYREKYASELVFDDTAQAPVEYWLVEVEGRTFLLPEPTRDGFCEVHDDCFDGEDVPPHEVTAARPAELKKQGNRYVLKKKGHITSGASTDPVPKQDNRLKKLKEENEQLQSKNEELRKEITDQKKRTNKLQDSINANKNNADRRVQVLKKRVQKFKEKANTQQEKKEVLEAKNEALEEKLNAQAGEAVVDEAKHEALRDKHTQLQEAHTALQQEHEALNRKLADYETPPTLQKVEAAQTRAEEAEAASQSLRKALDRKETTIERLQEKLDAHKSGSVSPSRASETSPQSEAASVVSKVSEAFVDWCRSGRALLERYYMFERKLHKSHPNTRVTPIYADTNDTFQAGADDTADAFWLVETGAGPLALPIPQRTGTFEALSPGYTGAGISPEALGKIAPARLVPDINGYQLEARGQLHRRDQTSDSDNRANKPTAAVSNPLEPDPPEPDPEKKDREAADVNELPSETPSPSKAIADMSGDEKQEEEVPSSEIVVSTEEDESIPKKADKSTKDTISNIRWENSPRAYITELLSSEKFGKDETLSAVLVEARNREQVLEEGDDALEEMRAAMEDWILSGGQKKEIVRVATGRYLITQKNMTDHMEDWVSSLHRVSRKVPAASLKGMHVAMAVASHGDDPHDFYGQLTEALRAARTQDELIVMD